MSDVTEEVLNIALITYHRTRPHEGAVVAMRHALAAVAPLIAAAERERCARVAHQHGYDLANLDERNGAFSAAAAIRALP